MNTSSVVPLDSLDDAGVMACTPDVGNEH